MRQGRRRRRRGRGLLAGAHGGADECRPCGDRELRPAQDGGGRQGVLEEDQRGVERRRGRAPLPAKPAAMRKLMELASYRPPLAVLMPDFLLRDFIQHTHPVSLADLSVILQSNSGQDSPAVSRSSE
ncbi:hypothetical protein GUJ93_ZPchr0011g27185 [Zizania palustris]|uniref:Uncharacterized protein n=1 Tax=Zizania palustris TaxID=103762 RepID=A0A8J5WKP4_ZIZPA|nr:hypothetical protein GUJ93_ZPchr0011g27185 [Zizania palustris]